MSRHTGSLVARWVGSALAVVLLAGSLVAVGSPNDRAAAADASAFDAGDIISDANFYDGDAMTAAQIQTFLAGQICTQLDSSPCLADFTQDTPTREPLASDSYVYCTTYAGGTAESAATIIAKVAEACGISPRVILVTLQKEEGLLTTVSAGRYKIAMGYGCPDTAACDSTYYGFFNQVYAAAKQWQRYTLYDPDTAWTTKVGTNAIRLNPKASCGTATVDVQNQATANLYNYTPYTPNAAALANLYGVGDSCSSYGNRNFWTYYTDWFGDPTVGGDGASDGSVAITSGFVTIAGSPIIYRVNGATLTPVENAAAMTALSGGPVTPTEISADDAAGYAVSARTLMQPGTAIQDSTGALYVVDGDARKIPLASVDILSDLGVTVGVRVVDDATASGYATATGAFTPIVRFDGTSYVATGSGITRLPGANPAGITPTPIEESTATGFRVAAPVALPLFVSNRANGRLYLLRAGAAHPVTAAAMRRIDASPTLKSLSAASVARIPKGARMFGPGTLVRAKSSGTVFLVNGTAKKSPLRTAAARAAYRVSSAVGGATSRQLAGYATTGAAAQVITCAGRRWFVANRRLYRLTPGNPLGLRSAALTTNTCANLPVGSSVAARATYVRKAGTSAVYRIVGGSLHRVVGAAERRARNGGKTPVVVRVAAAQFRSF